MNCLSQGNVPSKFKILNGKISTVPKRTPNVTICEPVQTDRLTLSNPRAGLPRHQFKGITKELLDRHINHFTYAITVSC